MNTHTGRDFLADTMRALSGADPVDDRSRLLRAAALALLFLPIGAGSQNSASLACGMPGAHAWQSTRPSPLDSAMLTVGDRVAVFCYSRPSARGRSVDSLVALGIAWRTGANEPTTLTTTGQMSVGGVVLPAGRYVILTVPQRDEWHIVFNTTPNTEPAKMFASLHQVAIGAGHVERTARSVEQFTVRAMADSADPAFVLEWGSWRVRIPVRKVP